MKRAWKKVLSLMLTVSMTLSILPTMAFAEGCTHECSVDNGCITEECVHEHDDDCYTSVLTCEEEHEHGEDCYEAELACDHVCTAESGCIVVDCLHEECDEDCGGLEEVSTGGGT